MCEVRTETCPFCGAEARWCAQHDTRQVVEDAWDEHLSEHAEEMTRA